MKPQAAFRFLLVGLLATSHVVSAQVVQNKKKGRTSNSSPDFKALMIAEAQAIDTLDMANAARFHSKESGDVFYDIAPLKYTGWAEYQAGTQKLMSQWTSMKCVLGDDLQTHRQGSFAWGISTWHCDIVQKSGIKEGMDGRWTVIWERRGKDWLVVHEHFSVPLAAPAASK